MNRDSLDLNALTDIVSNAIGMIILLTLVAALHRGAVATQVRVPFEAPTEKAPEFFICKDGAVIHLDIVRIADDYLAAMVSDQDVEGDSFELPSTPGVRGRIRSKDHAMELLVDDISQWDDVSYLGQSDPIAPHLWKLDLLDEDRQYAYFFIYDNLSSSGMSGSGFDAYRKLRLYLESRRVLSGWRPVSEAVPPVLCSTEWDPALGRACTYPVSVSTNRGP